MARCRGGRVANESSGSGSGAVIRCWRLEFSPRSWITCVFAAVGDSSSCSGSGRLVREHEPERMSSGPEEPLNSSLGTLNHSQPVVASRRLPEAGFGATQRLGPQGLVLCRNHPKGRPGEAARKSAALGILPSLDASTGLPRGKRWAVRIVAVRRLGVSRARSGVRRGRLQIRDPNPTRWLDAQGLPTEGGQYVRSGDRDGLAMGRVLVA